MCLILFYLFVLRLSYLTMCLCDRRSLGEARGMNLLANKINSGQRSVVRGLEAGAAKKNSFYFIYYYLFILFFV